MERLGIGFTKTLFICYCALRVQKYGNDGPETSFSKIVHNTVRKVCGCFYIDLITDVTKENSCVNKTLQFSKETKLSQPSFCNLKKIKKFKHI